MSFADLDLRHLRALMAVAEEGSFIDAAYRLGVSQAAVSQQIAGLERAVGQRAFDRPGGPRPVTLTPAGRALLAHAEQVMATLEAAERELGDLASGTGGRLTIGTYQSVSVQLLPDVVSRFLANRKPTQVACQVCHCTEDQPCRLSDGDQCAINIQTRRCSKPSCQAELAKVVKYAKAG